MLRQTLSASSEAPSRALGLLRGANSNPLLLERCSFVLLAMPALGLAWSAAAGALGANPHEQLIRAPGYWALVLLLATLTLSPLRQMMTLLARATRWRAGKRFSDWNWLIRLRRPCGLASFFYASAHLALYATLDLGLDWRQWLRDALDKPYIMAGAAALLLLLPLAMTSTDGWMRRLKRNWKRLHKLVYPAAVLAAMHFLWLSKPGVDTPYHFALVLVVLLGSRVVLRRWRPAAEGVAVNDEVLERAALPVQRTQTINQD